MNEHERESSSTAVVVVAVVLGILVVVVIVGALALGASWMFVRGEASFAEVARLEAERARAIEMQARAEAERAMLEAKAVGAANRVAVESSGKPLAPETLLEPGTQLQCQWNDAWYAVDVVEVLPDGRVKIHWHGLPLDFDEIVARDRLQLARPDGL